jgi:heat shock protein HtpX
MKNFKRIGLFLLTNVLVMVTISIAWSIISSVFGFNLGAVGGLGGLMVFCLLWGMGGAFISLFISKFMAKSAYGVKIIDSNTMDSTEREVLNMVKNCAERAGLKKMPEVGIYESDVINAFATGPSKSNSLVAVSTGLLNSMSRDEVEGVIGHEVAHIANGDMVTMTLIQGVVNAFAMFISRILARIISSNVDEKISGVVYFAVTIVGDILFTILGSILVNYFSRQREFRADAGGAQFAGRQKMIAGLQKLQAQYQYIAPDNSGAATMKISNKSSGLLALFSSHPPLEERIARLQKGF